VNAAQARAETQIVEVRLHNAAELALEEDGATALLLVGGLVAVHAADPLRFTTFRLNSSWPASRQVQPCRMQQKLLAKACRPGHCDVLTALLAARADTNRPAPNLSVAATHVPCLWWGPLLKFFLAVDLGEN